MVDRNVGLLAIIIHQRESCGERLPWGVAWESRAPARYAKQLLVRNFTVARTG